MRIIDDAVATGTQFHCPAAFVLRFAAMRTATELDATILPIERFCPKAAVILEIQRIS